MVCSAAGAKAPAAEGEAEGEPAAEGEAESEAKAPGAEAEGPKPAGEAAAEGASPAAAPAAEAEAPSRRRRLAQAEGAAAEGAPAAEGEAPAAEGEGAAAEGEGAGGGACAVQDSVFVPGMLGAGEAMNGTAAAPAAAAEGAAAEGEAPAAEGEAPAEAPAEAAAEAPAGGRRLLRMPLVEAETVAGERRGTRSLLQNAGGASAEGEAAPAEGEGAAAEGAGAEGEGAAAEGEGGGSGGKPVEITTGECAGFKATPANAHPMANQDVIFGVAREIGGTQYFRVVDMYTPSRAKPLPDHDFCFDGVCGSDSIEDAIGALPLRPPPSRRHAPRCCGACMYLLTLPQPRACRDHMHRRERSSARARCFSAGSPDSPHGRNPGPGM